MSQEVQSALALIMDVVGPLVLAIALIYGIFLAARRRRTRAADRVRDDATRELYRTQDHH